MKKVLKVASVLTWFNLIFWGLVVGFGLLVTVFAAQLPILGGLALLSAIPLNCYASLKLHTSIRYSSVPLSHQTPVGIRFVGLMALFFGITLIISGFSNIVDPGPSIEVLKEFSKQVPEDQRQFYPAMENKAFVGFVGAAVLILGLMVGVNVVLNLRLLRWYYLVHKSDVS